MAVVGAATITRLEVRQEAARLRQQTSETSDARTMPSERRQSTMRRDAVRFLVVRSVLEQEVQRLTLHLSHPPPRSPLTDAGLNDDPRLAPLQGALWRYFEGQVRVPASAVHHYYLAHRPEYVVARSRLIAHIRVRQRADAWSLYQQLRAGADFKRLARAFSIDDASNASGGVIRAYQNPRRKLSLERVVFRLCTGCTSEPVHDEWGYHIVRALEPAVARHLRPENQVRVSIRANLARQQRSALINRWFRGIHHRYLRSAQYDDAYSPGWKFDRTP